MAFVGNLTAAYDVVDRATYTTASISPTNGNICLITVGTQRIGAASPTPTVSGAGLTWTLVNVAENGASPFWQCAMFVGTGTPSAGTLSISFGGTTEQACSWVVDEFSGINTTTPVIQSAATSNSSTSTTVTLAAFASASNIAYGAFVHRVNESITVGSGFSQAGTINGTGPDQRTTTEYKLSSDTTVDASWSTSNVTSAVACELNVTSGNATPTPSAVAAVTTVPAPTVTASAPIPAASVATTTTVPAATVLTGLLIQPAVVATTTTVPTPTITTTADIPAAAVATTTTFPTATPVTSTTVTPAAVATTTTVPAPALVFPSVITPAAVAMTTTIGAPTIDIEPGPGFVGAVVVLTEKPYIVQVSDDHPYHVNVANEKPYSVTIIDEEG